LIWATPRWRPASAALLAVAATALPIALGFIAFASRRLVFDAAAPAIGLFVLFSALLLLAHADASRERRRLERVIQGQREQAAYIAGELQAAKRIQTGFLPRADALVDDPRVEVAANLVPAREVGGDLYDFFRLDGKRLFFMIGDVAGKGLSASMFMGVSKALYKSNVLRSWQAGVGSLMRAANDEVSRDNPEMFFVTAFAAILDLDTGVVTYSNAGHDNPYVLSPAGELSRLGEAAGPPLCTVEGFGYADAERRLQTGEIVCLVTDGITDARDTHGERYGAERLRAVLNGLSPEARTARGAVDAIASDVGRFSAGAEAADDLTVVVVRWMGPMKESGAAVPA